MGSHRDPDMSDARELGQTCEWGGEVVSFLTKEKEGNKWTYDL